MRIKSIKLNTVLYHGSAHQKNEQPFETFDPSISEWDAVWFTDDEEIAQEFSIDRYNPQAFTNVIYKVQIKATRIADIPYEVYAKLSAEYKTPDLRDLIPVLVDKGWRGWRTIGALGIDQYIDYAIFDLSTVRTLAISTRQATGNWGPYNSL